MRIWQVDPSVPITGITSFDQLVANAVSQQRYRARLMMAFAGLAAIVAMMGVYGVTARSVARRTRFCLAAFGVILGVGVSFFATRLLEDLLFEVSRNDPLSILAIAALVGVTSVAASLPPSRRATRVDPIGALRTE